MQDKQQAQEAQGITIDTSGYNPALDPASPEFDPAAWKAAVDAMGGIPAFEERIKAAFADPADRARQYLYLTMGQIKQLSQAEQHLVWDEIARQLVETPGFVAFMDSVTGATQNLDAISSSMATAIESAQKTFSAIVPTLTIAAESWDSIAARIGTTLFDTPHKWDAITSIGTKLADAGSAAKRAIDALLEGDGIEDYLQTWEMLQPYMDAEYDENPDKYSKANLSDLIAAAARRARADGKDIPTLKAEQGQAEQLEMDLDLPTEETAKEDDPQAAEQQPTTGAITTLDNHVATIADKLLQYCFTSRSMWQLPGKHDDFIFDPAGKLNELSLNGEPLQPLDKIHTGFLMALLQLANICDLRVYNSTDNPNIGVPLPAFFRQTGIDPRPREWDKAAKELKKRTPAADDQQLKQLRVKRFMEFMRPLDNRVGVIEGEGYYTLARFISWDEKSDTAYISIPYEIKLVELARLHTDRHTAISTIFHADILTENQAAVELANRIAVGLIERGVTRSQAETYKNDTPRKPIRKTTTTTAADGTKTTETLHYQPDPDPVTVTKERTDENGITTTVTRTNPRPRIFRWESRFDTLIAACPQLQREIADIKTAQGAEETKVLEAAKAAGKPATPAEIAAARKIDHKTDPQRTNKKLKDVFTAAIRIIMEKSDAPNYYAGLEIKTGKLDTFKAPTNSTLKEKLVITHKGKNPDYVD